jgi:hypothetical protein
MWNYHSDAYVSLTILATSTSISKPVDLRLENFQPHSQPFGEIRALFMYNFIAYSFKIIGIIGSDWPNRI